MLFKHTHLLLSLYAYIDSLLKIQLVDTLFCWFFSLERMGGKVRAHKRTNDGIETARNSVALQVETSQIHHKKGELPYFSQIEDEWPKNNGYSNVASVRKLINKELFKQSGTRNNATNLVARLMGLDMMPLDTESIVNSSYSNVASVRKLTKQPGARNSAPNLVARLMGLDMMPLDTKSVVLSDQSISENMGKKISKKGMNGRDSSNFKFSNQMKFDSFYRDVGDDGRGQNFGKPKPRGHLHQEDELQKFKREFEAYQAARFKECSKDVENGSISQRMNAQESLNKEIVLHNASSQREAAQKSVELDSQSFKARLTNGDMMESIPAKQKEPFPSKSRTLSKDVEESLMMKSKSRLDTSPPTQIVVLKPGPDSICNCNQEEDWIDLSGTLQWRTGIEDLLEEVRERLICELQGKIVQRGSAVQGRGIEMPYIEKPSKPKEIAHHMSNGLRERVIRDVEANLLRSESTRSNKSEIGLNESSSPEFINGGTRRLLSKRLRNVVKSEVHFDFPEVACRNSRSYVLDNHIVRLKQEEDTMKCSTDMSCCQILNDEKEGQAESFMIEPDDSILLRRELSPRNLVRSLSAPVSGTSFGRFLPEDHGTLRKLEAVETMNVDVKKQKKHRFNIKDKISNFKHRFGLRVNLFAKRIQSMVEPHGNEYGFMVKDIRRGPTVLMKHGERHENPTEVPPSPASLCSGAQEELWRWNEYLSPISTPASSSVDDNVMPQVYRDIHSGLNDLSRQLSQTESDGPEEPVTKQELAESELVQLEDPAESYIRDLLVASGLYFGSWDKYLSRGDTCTKPIGYSVFEEVEESHKKYLVKENERYAKDQDENKLEHKVLLDLLNEALCIVLRAPLTMYSFKMKLQNFYMQPPPRGKELLKLAWDIIHASSYPASNSSYSLDSLVATDLGSISWYGLINDQINIFGREISCSITDDLVEELTKDMCSYMRNFKCSYSKTKYLFRFIY